MINQSNESKSWYDEGLKIGKAINQLAKEHAKKQGLVPIYPGSEVLDDPQYVQKVVKADLKSKNFKQFRKEQLKKIVSNG